MTRALKFRVFDRNTSEMWYGAERGIPPVLDFEDLLDDPCRYVLMQFTGLKDKNGREVYEGDILGDFYGGYIVYCDTCQSFELMCGPELGCMACLGDLHWYEIVEDPDLEVIGNIHENKDVLEEFNP